MMLHCPDMATKLILLSNQAHNLEIENWRQNCKMKLSLLLFGPEQLQYGILSYKIMQW